MHIRKAEKSESDIDFILHVNKAIEGENALLSKERLLNDIFISEPKADIYILESNGKSIGLIFSSLTYWASCGPVFWISQMYIEPHQRGKHLFKIKAWLYNEAKNKDASLIVWGTEKKAKRTLKLWQKAGAKELNSDYSFWYKSIEQE